MRKTISKSALTNCTFASTLACMIAACSPAVQGSSEAETGTLQAAAKQEASAESDAPADGPDQAADFDPAQMPAMSQTGWRVLGEDGGVYTTFFDADGTYRDFKNGEALQSGSWEERNDGQLCFTPAEEGRIGECWELGMVGGDAMMQATSDAGKSIDLRQVTYIAPVEEG